MRDDESQSLWDHISGESFEGHLAGRRLPFWGVELTTVEAELADHPESILIQSESMPWYGRLMRFVFGNNLIGKKGTILPPRFRSSMNSKIDERLPEGENGLGIMDEDNNAKFYRLDSIEKGDSITDEWKGRKLIIERGRIDGTPRARWADGSGRPMQLLTRWYGFSFTYPGCEIYE